MITIDNQTINSQIRTGIDELCSRKGISKSKLATMIGVSPSALTNLEANSDETNNRIRLFISPKQELQLVATVNFQTVHKVANDAKRNHKLTCIIGYTGAGKTTALTNYSENNRNVYYLKCIKSMRPKQFFRKLIQEMGLSYSGSIYEMIERISEELNSKKNPLIIIDEAGKLTQTVLMYLHDLRNLTEGSTGMLLAGVEYFKTNLEKWVDRQKEGMPEFYDRIMYWQELKYPTKSEVRAICEAYGINDAEIVGELAKLRSYRKINNEIENIKQFTFN